jgi:hypothetical protein
LGAGAGASSMRKSPTAARLSFHSTSSPGRPNACPPNKIRSNKACTTSESNRAMRTRGGRRSKKDASLTVEVDITVQTFCAGKAGVEKSGRAGHCSVKHGK